jgi:CBS domain-containing protein
MQTESMTPSALNGKAAGYVATVEDELADFSTSTNLTVAFPDEPLHAALTKMLNRDVGRLPVVERNNLTRVVGYLGRAAILSARIKTHEEENVLQRG